MGTLKHNYHNELARATQRWVSDVFFVCPVCNRDVRQEVDVPEPNYAGEKASDMVSEGDVELHCGFCDSYFDGDVWSGPAHCDITLREFPDTIVSCDPPAYNIPPEDWDDEWEVPEDPAIVFKANAAELQQLINDQAQPDGSSLINRMIFAQILTFLEAYFCDALISSLRKRPDLLANFAEKDGAISQTKFQASLILRDPDYVRKAIEHDLKSRLYHKFGSGKVGSKGKSTAEGVALWYGMAFGFPLTATEDDLTSLRDYATLRHDCVHRNGKTKDDETLDMFDKNYLRAALALAERVVDHVDSSIKNLPPETPELF